MSSCCFFELYGEHRDLHVLTHSFPTRRSSDLQARRFLLVEYDIPRGCLAAYYPETNALVPLSSFADHARTPTPTSIPPVVSEHHDSDNVPGAAPRETTHAVDGGAGKRQGRSPGMRAKGVPRARKHGAIGKRMSTTVELRGARPVQNN